MARAFRIALSELTNSGNVQVFVASSLPANVLRELRIKLVVKPVLNDANATRH